MPTVLITGANRGIGLELARQYAAAGWTVYATCRDASRVEALNAAAAAAKANLHVVAMDVNDKAQVEAVAERLKDVALDLLINNAGIMRAVGDGKGAYEGRDDPDLRNYDFDNWLEVLRTNLLGPARVCGAFVDHLTKGQRPVAVNISSGLASIANTWQAGRYPYRASKAALNMLTRGVGAWYETKGIIIGALAPGWTRTDMGGPNAANAVEQSVAGMREVIAGLTRADSGNFLKFDGEALAW